MKPLNIDNLNKICGALNKLYPAEGELSKTMDELLYLLFYIDRDHITAHQQQNTALFIKKLKEILEEQEV